MDISNPQHEHQAKLAAEQHSNLEIINMDEQISEPLSCTHNKINTTPQRPSYSNFIKSLRKGHNFNIACIYEAAPFTVQIRNLSNNKQQIQSTHVNQSSQQSTNHFMNLSNEDNNIVADIRFQTLPYDCLQFRENSWIVSSQSMPLRIYRCQSDTPVKHIGSFTQKKKNSQSYLAPIQLAGVASRSDYVLGGGHRFLCSYNIEKIVTDRIFNKFSKANVSAVSVIDQNTAVVGTFQGGLTILDVRQSDQQAVNILRPHVDAVMSIDSNRQNGFIFASNARKDHYTYIWDVRKWNQSPVFVNELQVQRYGNQRISLCFSEDGQYLYCGSENSEIVSWSWKNNSKHEQVTSNQQQLNTQTIKQQNVKKYKVQSSTTINSIVQFEQLGIVFSTGCRNYADMQDQDDVEEHQKIHNEPKNLLGLMRKNMIN